MMDKTMEKEYKWRADEKLLGQALLWASSRIGSQSRTINMESSYFDCSKRNVEYMSLVDHSHVDGGSVALKVICAARTTAACAA